MIGSHGVKYPVSFLKVNGPVEGRQVINPKVADEALVMLESVVSKGGTATRARIPGYTVAGKTGTTRIVGPNGYEKDHHNAFFVGLAPASHPKLVVTVMLRDPQGGQYYGGLVAAPVFAKVMGGALEILNVPSDKADGSSKDTHHG